MEESDWITMRVIQWLEYGDDMVPRETSKLLPVLQTVHLDRHSAGHVGCGWVRRSFWTEINASASFLTETQALTIVLLYFQASVSVMRK